MPQTIMVLTNVPDMATAQKIARELVEQRLAACVNILPVVQSVYRWQGTVEETSEVTVLAKTVFPRYAELEETIKALHPYDVPEIIALPIVHGLPNYLGWIEQETARDVNV